MVMIGSRGAPAIYNPGDPMAMSAQAGAPEMDAQRARLTTGIANSTNPSLWDRIGAELHKPGVAAALFRGGAATLRDGFGSGLAAMAGYMDDQRALATRGQQQAFDNDLATRAANLADLRQQQAYHLGLLGAENTGDANAETARHNRAGEAIDANGQRIQLHGIDTQAATTQRGQTLDYDVAGRRIAQDDTNSQRSYGANIYGTNVGYMADAARTAAAGIGSKANAIPYTETKTKIPARNPWLGHPTPATETTTHIPMVVTPTPAAAPASAVAALKANPNLRGQFEAKYGAGSAAQFLGGR